MSHRCIFELFPKTRYLGSKRKLLGPIGQALSELEFETALDAFSGTGCVSYLMKSMGKSVTAADVLESNVTAARALVENNETVLGHEAELLCKGLPDFSTDKGFVERTFDGIFFDKDENRFIDGIVPRIRELIGYKRDLAFYALFQSCLAKRPYNLFHRANLAMRKREVKRSFGNKVMWDTPFKDLILRFAKQADKAVICSNKSCRAVNSDALKIDPLGFDLVYLDPPYVSAAGSGVDYLDYYHFLEGLIAFETWENSILTKYKHKPLKGRGQSPWCKSELIGAVFEQAIKRFSKSTIVISYRSDGTPSIDELAGLLKKAKNKVQVMDLGSYTYALSRNNRSREMLIIGV